MATFAAVITGKGTGAIASIALYGPGAAYIIGRIFKPRSKSDKSFAAGEVILGEICDGNTAIDQVLIGCEEPEHFAINCHGNPLIVADIMRLLQKHDAQTLSSEQLLVQLLMRSGESGTIAIEAKLAVAHAKTLEATRTIIYQADEGLNRTATGWLENPELKTIQAQAEDILQHSIAARPLLFGAKIVLAGPPNSGKSTLLNFLAGKQKAIVTELEGTTRDWVSAECVLGRIYADVIDTCGIDRRLFSDGKTIEKIAQQKAKELLATADLILLVLDANAQVQESLTFFAEILAGKKGLAVLNKVDLPVRFDTSQLPQNLNKAVSISAKFATGCDQLVHSIEQILGAENLDHTQSLCFTARQEQILQQITAAKDKEQAVSAVSELLNGRLGV